MPKVLIIHGHKQLHPDRSGEDLPAECECGWRSEDLTGISPRRGAHRAHKEELWRKSMGT